MSNPWCMNCFQYKGEYEVCPYCGYVENSLQETTCQLKPGTVLRKRYMIGKMKGIGGFGIIYKGFDTALGIMVAVKEFYPARLVRRMEGEERVSVFSGERVGEFKRQLARFLNEAQNLALFSKEPEIVQVYDYFEENGTAYIVMEYVNAPLLKEYLKIVGKIPAPEACAYMLSLLNAVEKIHEQGILHRDVSPDNIFLVDRGKVKLFDFGAAKFLKEQDGEEVPLVVKPGYAPIEQYRSNWKQGFSMDLYAAGAVFYEMLTGRKPPESLDRLEQDDLRMPSEMGEDMDPVIEEVIRRAMNLNPEKRYRNAREFKRAILKE